MRDMVSERTPCLISLLFPCYRALLSLHVNLSVAACLAQSTVIAFHTQHKITLLVLLKMLFPHTVANKQHLVQIQQSVFVTERD